MTRTAIEERTIETETPIARSKFEFESNDDVVFAVVIVESIVVEPDVVTDS